MNKDTQRTTHTPVLLHEVIELLAVHQSDVVLDGTAGGGGHAESLLPFLGDEGIYVAIDADAAALDRVRSRLGEDHRVRYVHGNFRDMEEHVRTLELSGVDRILLDLGLSSDQLDVPQGRGFSFKTDEPLVMTFADTVPDGTLTAWHVVNEWSEENLADILYGFGGERRSRKIARAICEAREQAPIERTGELAALIAETVGTRGATHPATRTFQAIRMAVNDELGALNLALESSMKLLRPEGRIAVITFHSLEDRIVKLAFRAWAKDGLGTILTKRPIAPSRTEQKSNRRARSAKLRGFMKTH